MFRFDDDTIYLLILLFNAMIIPGSLTSYFMLDHEILERRLTIVIGILAEASCLILFILFVDSSFAIVLTCAFFCFFAFIAFAGIYCLAPECYPASCRGTTCTIVLLDPPNI